VSLGWVTVMRWEAAAAAWRSSPVDWVGGLLLPLRTPGPGDLLLTGVVAPLLGVVAPVFGVVAAAAAEACDCCLDAAEEGLEEEGVGAPL
jgi:hypothetical protein